MTFFENQARARRSTTHLVVLFALAVIGVVVAVNLVVPLAVYLSARGLVTLPPALYAWLTAGTLAVIGTRTVVGVMQMRGGGDAVARLAGGVRVDRGTRDADERRLLNVVDEMAIASGVSVPRVYLLPGERGLNAFAAGYSPNEAVIAVTEGAARTLTRDELQGVIAHEFSHVLNGDMRLNVQMIGVLAGILFIGEIGNFLLRIRTSGDSRKGGGGLLFVGAALLIIGYAGLFFGRLIKAAVSRQREFLADASSVQFTRNPEGIAGALATIAAEPGGSLVVNRRAETLSHMFFANGVTMWFESMFATHPPLLERIARVDARFNPVDYLRRRRPRAAEPLEKAAAVAPARAAAAPVPVAATPLAPAPAPDARAARVAGVLGSVGRVTPSHVRYAGAVLENLPAAVHDAVADPEGASALVLAQALSDDEGLRKQQRALLEGDGAEALARRAEALAAETRALPPETRLPVIALAGPSLRRLEPAARETLARRLRMLVEADHRITLEESVLLTLARRHLAPTAGRNVPVRFRSVREVPDDARLVLSLLAHAGSDDTAAAFARGMAALELSGALVPREAMEFATVGETLGRLAALAPFVKGRMLEACVETVIADEAVTVIEAEMLRAVAAALDCPVPPILAS